MVDLRQVRKRHMSQPCNKLQDQPLFSAPQQSQWRMFFSVPLDAGKRLPQSVQKIKEPMAAIFAPACLLAEIVA
jgi:hypothetical protein